MGKFGGKYPKPHVVYSNDYDLVIHIQEVAGYMSREEMLKCPERTCRTYTDKQGVKRSVGLKREMKDSQLLGLCLLTVLSWAPFEPVFISML